MIFRCKILSSFSPQEATTFSEKEKHSSWVLRWVTQLLAANRLKFVRCAPNAALSVVFCTELQQSLAALST